MTFRPSQLRKETRPLFWPWILLILSGLLSLVSVRSSSSLLAWAPMMLLFRWLPPVGCFLGIPLLAALPIGYEFQHRTLTSLLAQPVERRKLWTQKFGVSLTATLPAVLLFLLAGRYNPDFMQGEWMPVAWMVATFAGAMAGTLIAKSTMGGFALASGVCWIFFFLWSYLADHQRKDGVLPNSFLWISALALLWYSTAMVLLGRWLFLRFQSVDGALAGDALSPISRLLPSIKINWLRARPHGAVLNLVFKELRLLRIVWLLSLLSFASWILLVLFHRVPGRGQYLNFYTDDLAVPLAVMLGFLIAILAGTLSLGEEKTMGTQEWHLALPISTPAQWLIKLLVALAVCSICALGPPLAVLLARGWLAGAPYSYIGLTPVRDWVLMAWFTTAVAFWCSCLVKGIVRAVLSYFLVFFAMESAMSLGGGAALHAVMNSKVLDWLLLRFDPFTVNYSLSIILTHAEGNIPFLVLTMAPLLIVGVIQSLRAFVSLSDERKLRIVRSAIPLLGILVLSGFLLTVPTQLVFELRKEQVDIIREAHPAIEALLASANADVASQRLKAADLAKASPLSERTRYWLHDATVLVRREKPRSGNPPRIQWPFEQSFADKGVQGKTAIPYSATIRTIRGSECTVSFWTSGQSEGGMLSESCQ